MTLQQLAIKAGEELERGVSRGDWIAVHRARERIMELLLSASDSNAADAIQTIQTALAKARTEMVWRHETGVVEDAEAISWMLESEARLALLASRMRPAAPRVNEADLGVRDRVLQRLSLTDRPLSNRELAQDCAAAEETVARILPGLREQGLVHSRRAGSRKVNSLTPRGRATVRDVTSGVMRLKPYGTWIYNVDNTPNDVRNAKAQISQIVSAPADTASRNITSSEKTDNTTNYERTRNLKMAVTG